MIKSLRKEHLRAWSILAVLIPLGIISAWLVVPQPVKDRLLQPAYHLALPVLIKKTEKENYAVSLRTNEDKSALQLEWINKSVLTAPSAIIYKASSQNSGDSLNGVELVGRIDGRGAYHFPLKKDSTINSVHLILYDIIHHQVIDRINF